ncbi:50S ribosomal protein L29 [Candidatus Margulisiibacteriota bacterium]
MKAAEIRKMNQADLDKELEKLHKKQKDLRFGKAKGELKNPLEKRQVKRDIARILTICREQKNGK